MAWELIADVETFAAEAGEFLRSRPVEHTVLLTLVGGLRRRGLHAYGRLDPVFGLWRGAGGQVEGVLLQTPPHPMLFSALPAHAVTAAADVLAGRSLTAVNMLAAQADEFVAGRPAVPRRRTRLYRLEALTPVPPPAGAARTADPGDRDLLRRWHAEFYDTIGEKHDGDFGPVVDERIADGLVSLWEVEGVPVSMAVRSGVESGMVRVQLVYTPPSLRARGYGGAVTTAATQAALDAGATAVVLFTDLANPTSNGLYQRLGYRPVEDRVVMEFAS